MYDARDSTGVQADWLGELARGEALRASSPSMLRHCLGRDPSVLFAEDIVARVRGMLVDLARQLSSMNDHDDEVVCSGPDASDQGRDQTGDQEDGLMAALIGEDALLRHLHALALEALLCERLRFVIGLDPIVSPLLQALIASQDSETAQTAMHLLAAQARFNQSQRRMQLPLAELPADLFHAAWHVRRAISARQAASARQATPTGFADEDVSDAERRARRLYDENMTRLGMAERLVIAMGGGVRAGLDLPHAGLSLFVSTMAHCVSQGRHAVITGLCDQLGAHTALNLRAAGLSVGDITKTLLILDAPVPEGLDQLSTAKAGALLTQYISSAQYTSSAHDFSSSGPVR